MCSRFQLELTPGDAMIRFGLAEPPPWPEAAEARPTDQVLALRGGRARLVPWGMAVPWDKRPLINARAETLDQRPAFRHLLNAGGRVLVPATAWWEWQIGADGKSRTRMLLSRADGAIMALAGLFDGQAAVIVTCAPAPAIAHVHDRMPVILPPEAETPWADPAVPFAAVAHFLRPFDGALRAVPDPASGGGNQGDLFG